MLRHGDPFEDVKILPQDKGESTRNTQRQVMSTLYDVTNMNMLHVMRSHGRILREREKMSDLALRQSLLWPWRRRV